MVNGSMPPSSPTVSGRDGDGASGISPVRIPLWRLLRAHHASNRVRWITRDRSNAAGQRGRNAV